MKLVETAINDRGDSYIYSQTNPHAWQMKGHLVTDLYFSPCCPPDLMTNDYKIENLDFNLSPGQVRFFRTDIYPTYLEYEKLESGKKIEIEKLFLHSTTTVDYVIVIEGELVLIVGNEKVNLKKGDCVIQRGAAHAWHNYTDSIATISGIMIGVEVPAQFKRIG